MDEEKAILIKAAGIWIGTLFKSNKFYYIWLEIIPPKEDGIPPVDMYVFLMFFLRMNSKKPTLHHFCRFLALLSDEGL